MTVHKILLFTIALMLMTPSFSTSGPDSHDGDKSGQTGHPQVHTAGGPAGNPDAPDARSTLDRLTLMPLPNGPVTPGEGRFRVDEHFTLAVQGQPDARIYPESTRLLRRLAGRTGLFLPQDFIREDTDAGSPSLLVRVERPGKLELHVDESYRLSITPERIRLDAATDLGALHGFETLLQLLDADADGYFFPAIELEDEPRFPWRGLMIDAARHFMPVDVIKRNLDGMAAVKLNVFHWHLTEDQGFRVESRTKPLLHEKGSDGEYYTQEEIRDIIRYADQRGIRVMPEFDIPGHATSWLVGYPELASLPGPYEIERGFGIFDPTLDPTREEVYEFLDVFLGEMADLFPDAYMHIGGDEVTGRHWDENPDIQQFMRENDIPDNQALQAYFNSRVMEILEKHGKIMVGWEEILHPDLPQDIVIQSWYGRQSMIDAARQGYQSILSHGYYIDLIQPTDLHYVNNPLPPDTPLNPEEQKLILGGEAPMWSEYVSWETIDSRIWPRTAAIAEVFWSVDVPAINLPSGREWFIPEDLLTPEIVTRLDDMYRRLEVIRIQLEEHGLTHDRNYPVMLRRLAGGEDIAAVKTFVDVVEPVKIYNRPRQRRHTSYSPLTRTVDAARPDAMVARQFRRLVDDYLAGGAADREMAATIREQLMVWRDNHAELEKVIRRSPILAEIETLSEDLARLSAVGIEALNNIREAQRPHPDWNQEAMSVVEAAREPRGQVEIMIVPAVEKLVRVADQRTAASPKHDFTEEPCFVSMWNHRRDLDPSGLVAELGINHIWSHDDAYNGQEWEETHMYRLLQIPGVDYVMAKIERAAWGWDHEMSLRHAKWVAGLSKEHPGIAGMYLNDFYDEVEDGYRTEEQWREIIDAAKSINPDLKLWVPHYPHRDQGRHAFDFDIDGVILNLWGNEPELMAQAKEHLAAGLAHHPDRPVIAGLYLRSGMDGGRWLTEDEFRFVYGHYVDMLNAGQLKGVRIFAAYQLKERPEYIEWAKEILESVTCR